jgi:hypothetical protein
MVNTACYAYTPVTGGAAPASAQLVRVRLTSEGTTELARFLGPRVVEVEGTLSKVGADGALVVGPEWVKLADGLRQPWSGEGVVTFPLRYTQGVEQRTFDRRKTILASVVTVVSAVGLALLAFGSISTKGDGSSPPPPPPP